MYTCDSEKFRYRKKSWQERALTCARCTWGGGNFEVLDRLDSGLGTGTYIPTVLVGTYKYGQDPVVCTRQLSRAM